jgi:predicted RNase H-like nuclease (RuvC/YqgF family)
VNHRQAETEINMIKDEGAVETALKAFWDKARAASELITRLRDELRALGERTERQERELLDLHADILGKDQELKRLRAEHAQLVKSDGKEFFTDEEKESLKNRIRELLAKINSHL